MARWERWRCTCLSDRADCERAGCAPAGPAAQPPSTAVPAPVLPAVPRGRESRAASERGGDPRGGGGWRRGRFSYQLCTLPGGAPFRLFRKLEKRLDTAHRGPRGGGGVQKELWMKQQATSNPGSAFLSCVTSDRTLHGSGLPLQFSSLKGEAWAGPNCESLVLGGLAKEPARPRVQILRLLLAGCLILGGTRPLVKPQFPRLLGRLRWWWSPASCHTCRCITRYSQCHG